MNSPRSAVQRRIPPQNQAAQGDHYNYHHQLATGETGSRNFGKKLSNPSTAGTGDNYKRAYSEAAKLGRWDLVPYAMAANKAPWCKKMQDWGVVKGAIVNALYCLGYHRVKQKFDMVEKMESYRFNKGRQKTEKLNRGGYLMTCLINEADALGLEWPSNAGGEE